MLPPTTDYEQQSKTMPRISNAPNIDWTKDMTANSITGYQACCLICNYNFVLSTNEMYNAHNICTTATRCKAEALHNQSIIWLFVSQPNSCRENVGLYWQCHSC